MTSLYNELYAHGWFGLAQVKQEAMHEHHRKKRQANKGKRVREKKGSYIFWINSQVLAEFFYSLRANGVWLILAFIQWKQKLKIQPYHMIA